MTESERKWCVQLAAAARKDLQRILKWTKEQFGDEQAHRYHDTLRRTLDDLAEGPELRGVKRRNDIRPGLMVLHMAREGRKGRHLIAFRTRGQQSQEHIEVLRILHDSMDLPRHLPKE